MRRGVWALLVIGYVFIFLRAMHRASFLAWQAACFAWVLVIVIGYCLEANGIPLRHGLTPAHYSGSHFHIQHADFVVPFAGQLMLVNDCQLLRADGQFENGSQKIGQHVKMSAEETFENMLIYRGEQGLFHKLIITIAKADDKHVIRTLGRRFYFLISALIPCANRKLPILACFPSHSPNAFGRNIG